MPPVCAGKPGCTLRKLTISEDQLKEVLGHTPREVIAGAGLGLVTSTLVWLLWH